MASAPRALAGLLEVRGLGVVPAAPCRLRPHRAGCGAGHGGTSAGARHPYAALRPAARADRPGLRLGATAGGPGARLRAGPQPAMSWGRSIDAAPGRAGHGVVRRGQAHPSCGCWRIWVTRRSTTRRFTLVEELVSRGERPVAIGLDARSRGFDATAVLSTLERLQLNHSLRPELVFAYADEEALLRRYTETRRRHPLAAGRPGGGRHRPGGGVDGVAAGCGRLGDRHLGHTPAGAAPAFGRKPISPPTNSASRCRWCRSATRTACRGKQTWYSMQALLAESTLRSPSPSQDWTGPGRRLLCGGRPGFRRFLRPDRGNAAICSCRVSCRKERNT